MLQHTQARLKRKFSVLEIKQSKDLHTLDISKYAKYIRSTDTSSYDQDANKTATIHPVDLLMVRHILYSTKYTFPITHHLFLGQQQPCLSLRHRQTWQNLPSDVQDQLMEKRLSPWTGKILKPIIWQDFESLAPRVALYQELHGHR